MFAQITQRSLLSPPFLLDRYACRQEVVVMGKHLGLKVLWFQASVHEASTTVCHVGCVLETPVLAEASMDPGGLLPKALGCVVHLSLNSEHSWGTAMWTTVTVTHSYCVCTRLSPKPALADLPPTSVVCYSWRNPTQRCQVVVPVAQRYMCTVSHMLGKGIAIDFLGSGYWAHWCLLWACPWNYLRDLLSSQYPLR